MCYHGIEMTDELPVMKFRAIGVVRNEVRQAPGSGYPWQEVISEIVLDDSLTAALDSLDGFSHIIVIYWLHRSTGRYSLKVRPQHREKLPLVGVFASRSPERPNPVGKTTVRLLQRRGNTLKVTGLDAINGTPVIDIKPYMPGYDSVEGAKTPSWTGRCPSTSRTGT